MTRNQTDLNSDSELREKVEEILSLKEKVFEDISGINVRKLSHELKIKQTELEIQSEELSKTKKQLEKCRLKYDDLYNFLPIAFLTFNQKGLVLEANLFAASLLDVNSKTLINKLFFEYLNKTDRDIFYSHLRVVFESGKRQECEIKINKEKELPWYAQLKSIVSYDIAQSDRCTTIISDISGSKRALETLTNLNSNS